VGLVVGLGFWEDIVKCEEGRCGEKEC
jgi:hypothetical protein